MLEKMTPERRLQRAKITLMRNAKFALMSGILMVGKTVVCDKTPTARTNGRDEFYGRAFIDKLKDKELAFVVMHEACHKMYRHMTTWVKLYEQDARRANAACDYVVNLMLRDLDPHESVIAMPKMPDGSFMGLLDEKYRGMNAKQVFDLLEQSEDDGRGGGGGMDEHDWDGANDMSEEDARELAREVDQAIRQGIIAHEKVNGKGESNLARELGELLKPKVDWREVLREFVKSVCAGKDASTWARPNRRLIGQDIYLPSLISETVGHIGIAVDTSGSVGGPELTAFLTEVVSVADTVAPETVDLLYWGSHIAGHEVYARGDLPNIVRSTKPVGGGGTSPSCITAYLKDKKIEPECVIVLTDGYVGNDWGGNWPCPVLWCIVGNNGATAPIGKTVHIKD